MFLKDIYVDYKKFSSHNGVILRVFFVLMLLHPLFMLTVRSWSSGIYSFLALLATGYLIKNRNIYLKKEIKIYLWLLCLFVISIIISSTLNDWTYNSYRRIGMEIKILLAIPFLILMSQHQELRKWFVYSIPLAGIILGIHGLFDVFVFHERYANAAYGKVITGDIAGLIVGLSGVILIYSNNVFIRRLCVLAMVLTAVACVLSTSRNGWIVLIVNMLFLLFLYLHKCKKSALLLLLLPVIAFIVAINVDKSQGYFNNAINEFRIYSDENKRAKANLRRSSVGYRLEQWRVTLIAFRDKPFFGVGPGNSGLVMNNYINKGIADPDLYHKGASYNMGHVHNQYLDTLLVQGVVGLTLILLIIFYPVWIFIKFYKNNEMHANLGLILMFSYAIFSLTEMPFVSDNFTSIFFIFIAIFLPNVMCSEE